jgi:hypothetical protein
MEPSMLFMKYDGNLGGTTGINALVPVLGMSAFFIFQFYITISNEKDMRDSLRFYREGRIAEIFLTQENNLPPWSCIGET